MDSKYKYFKGKLVSSELHKILSTLVNNTNKNIIINC